MGKNKNKKKDHAVFKVAGSKVTKVKSKVAKPVATNLKRLKQPSKTKTEAADDIFTDVRQSLVSGNKTKKTETPKVASIKVKEAKPQVDISEAMEAFDKL